MERHELEKLVIEAINDVQKLSGESHDAVTSTSCPIKDLPTFDSLRGLEVTTVLEGKLGISLEENVFVSEDGTRALKVKEVVERIEHLSK
jgi:acyl carrier protein